MHTDMNMASGQQVAGQEFGEQLDAHETAAIERMLGPRGRAVLEQLALLQAQGVFDAMVVENGEVAFYAAERDFYVVSELPRPASGPDAA